ncbi:MAG: o-succinylbenzoate synthase [Kiritimatiellia bacterium]|jgi:O-succinylbenzoate synthase
MHIDHISIRRICNPIKRPYRTAFGSQNAFNSILISLTCGNNTGWGEAAPGGGPFFLSEYDLTEYCVSRDFIVPQVLGKNIHSSEALQDILAPIRGHRFAKAAFDVAWWDLYSQQQLLPLYRAIGSSSNTCSIGYTFGVLNNYDELLAGIGQVVGQGYPRVKLKFCPGWELDMLSAVRSTFPDLTIHIDCNSAYTLNDLPMLKKLDQFHLAMIEQPLQHDDLINHAELQSKIGTPVCLDESITTPEQAQQAIRIKACKYINIKYGRVGGITPSLQIQRLCADNGIGCWLGGMGESSLGTTVVASLATMPQVNYPSDISPSDKFYVQNLGRPVLSTNRPGMYKMLDNPGLNVVPDPDALQKFTVEKEEFSE